MNILLRNTCICIEYQLHNAFNNVLEVHIITIASIGYIYFKPSFKIPLWSQIISLVMHVSVPSFKTRAHKNLCLPRY